MPYLPDGTVVPSNLDMRQPPSHNDQFGDYALHAGEVQHAIYPHDPRSRSKRFVEYDVLVQDQRGQVQVNRLYHSCILVNDLMGLADSTFYTLRGEDSATTKKGLGAGSKVLIQCINGETSRAMIVGGFPDHNDSFQANKAIANKHIYHTVFNGVSVDINDDGEVTVGYNGKTKIDGTTDGSVKHAPSTVSFTKDGKISILPNTDLEIGSATDHLLLGESFRKAQKKQNQQFEQQLAQLQGYLQIAGTTLQTAATSLQGATDAAVQAAALQFLAVAASLTQAASAVRSLGKAVTQFESAAAQKNSFLSDRHSSD